MRPLLFIGVVILGYSLNKIQNPESPGLRERRGVCCGP